MSSKKSQAAFEYMVTYGWAILAAIIAIGALSYFGFISPSNLLPNKCNFGRQLECTEYEIIAPSNNKGLTEPEVHIMFRNNFGKPIVITDVNMVEDGSGVTGNHPLTKSIDLPSGATVEVPFFLDQNYRKGAGEKQGINLVITFTRADVAGPEHTVTGYVYTTVSSPVS